VGTVTAFDRMTDVLRDAGKTVDHSGDNETAQCPAHDHNPASLSVLDATHGQPQGSRTVVLPYEYGIAESPYVGEYTAAQRWAER
jgi:hypothetical protein